MAITTWGRAYSVGHSSYHQSHKHNTMTELHHHLPLSELVTIISCDARLSPPGAVLPGLTPHSRATAEPMDGRTFLVTWHRFSLCCDEDWATRGTAALTHLAGGCRNTGASSLLPPLHLPAARVLPLCCDRTSRLRCPLQCRCLPLARIHARLHPASTVPPLPAISKARYLAPYMVGFVMSLCLYGDVT